MPEWLTTYPEESVVRQAYAFAEEAHRDAKRENGDPYITHCLTVANTVREWGLCESSISAALLHDVVEDTAYTLETIQKKFGEEIAFLVDGLTKLDKINYRTKNPDVENLRKFIISSSKDLRIVIIKLADRLHNMQTLRFLPEVRQKRFAWETAEIYAPLAYRLGMQRLSGALEDLAFPYTHPEEYEWLINEVKDDYRDREAYAEKILPIVIQKLHDNNIRPIHVDSRPKRYSSLYKKLMRYDMDIGKIYDLVAIRIIVKTIEDCYATLGIIHKYWPPLPGRIKDYIARPKPNGYRSLHTSVFCVENRITEFQIRTEEMHKEAELGIAAHWAYQQIKHEPEKRGAWRGVRKKSELVWVEQLRNWQEHFTNQKEFIEAMKAEFFRDRIFVITPENDILDLPAGATPVDFAYHIHSDIGDQAVGAKVNGNIVPLDYELKSGDIVEIMTQKGKKPSDSWLKFVKTSVAKSHIRSVIRSRQHAPQWRKPTKQPEIEFKIINEDRPGFLKEVTSAFAQLKINITFLTSATDERMKYSSVRVKCPCLKQQKLEKLLVKIKKIPGVREVRYRTNR